MLLKVLMGQRECRYEGQYAPEALEVVDEYTDDENPDYMTKKFKEHSESGNFTGVAIINITLGALAEKKIDEKLRNPETTVAGHVD